MGFFNKVSAISSKFATEAKRIYSAALSTARNPADWFVDWVSGSTRGKIRVNAESAVTLPEIWYAISRIGGHVGTLPLQVIERTDERNKRKARNHPAWALHSRSPNKLMRSCVFRETLQVHALLRGNGRSWIERDRAARPIALHLLPANTITVLVNGEKWHVCTLLDELDKPIERKIKDADCLHILGLSFDGIVGLDLVKAANDSFGIGLASMRSAKRLHENYGIPGLLLSAPQGTFSNEDQAKEFLERFRQMHDGMDNVGKTALLRNGITATLLQQNASDMQQIETRRVSRQDAALWFLLESIIGDDTSVSYNSEEQKKLSYLSNCLMRWLIRWEQESDEKLLSTKEKKESSHYHRFNVDALLRTDAQTKSNIVSNLIRARVLNPNEGRDLYDWNSYEGGDEYANPAITTGKAGGQQSK